MRGMVSCVPGPSVMVLLGVTQKRVSQKRGGLPPGPITVVSLSPLQLCLYSCVLSTLQ